MNSSVSTMPTRSFSNSSVWLANQDPLQSIITTSCGSCTPMLHWLTLRHTRLHQRPMFASSETATVSLSNSSQTVCLSTCPIYLSPLCPSVFCMSICLPASQSLCLRVCLPVFCLSTCLSAGLLKRSAHS